MNSNNKVTIKVRLSDEDYQDITIDWSDESCEYKQQLFMRKIASFTKIPIENFALIFFVNGPIENVLGNIETKFSELLNFGQLVDNVDNETFMSFFNDGDRFCLNTTIDWIAGKTDFVLNFDMENPDEADVPQCNAFWCHYMNTRALMNKRVMLITDPEFKAKINAEKARWPDATDGATWSRFFANININHLLLPNCRANMMDTGIERCYYSYRG